MKKAKKEPAAPAATPRAQLTGEERIVPILLIDENPENPRGEISEADVRDLADSIETHGLFHPLLVDKEEGGRYRLRDGHRRLAALRILRRELAAVRFYSGTEPRDSAVPTVVANEHREELDPLREAAVVRDLIEQRGGSAEDVAATLSRTVSWVHRRARLAQLVPKIAAQRGPGGAVASWPVSWLEELAALPAPTQERLLEGHRLECVSIREDLVDLMLAETSELGEAPWSLEDAELVPACGACSVCPKRSVAQPGLFDGDLDRKGAGRCLEPDCYRGKLTEWRRSALAAANARHGGEVLVVHGANGFSTLPRAKRIKGVGPVLETFDFVVVGKKDRGAKPALVVDGKGVGTLQWIRPKPPRPSRVEADRKPRELTPGEQLEVETIARAQPELWALVQKVKQPSVDQLLVLVTAYGIEIENAYVERPAGVKGDTRERRLKRTVGECCTLAWRGVLTAWRDFPFARPKHGSPVDQLREMRERGEECAQLARFLDLGWGEIRVEAGKKAAAALEPKNGKKPTGKVEGAPAKTGKGRRPARSSPKRAGRKALVGSGA